VPMLLGGDEIGRSQQGNNNAYCQDNEISWYDWDNADEELLAFTRKLIAFRHSHPVFRRRRWFQGRAIHGVEVNDIAWFTHEGEQLAEEDWGEGYAKSLGVYLNGKAIPNPNPKNEPVTDDSFYVIFNAHYEPLTFRLPSGDWGENWTKEFDTAAGWAEDEEACPAGSTLEINARTLSVLRQI